MRSRDPPVFLPHLTVNYFQLGPTLDSLRGGGGFAKKMSTFLGRGSRGEGGGRRGGGMWTPILARGLTLSDGFESVQAKRMDGHLKKDLLHHAMILDRS